MQTQVKRSQRDYTLAFKLGVVDQVEKGQMSYKQAQRHFGIQGRSTVLVWLRRHGKLDWASRPSAAQVGGFMSTEPASPLTPEQQIKALQVQLKEANEKAQLFEAMLDVIKKEYGVRLTKKPSGKSCKTNASKA
jgi:transposase